VAAITFKGGDKAFFDGPKDLFRYYLAVDKYAKGKKQTDIEQVYVTEYYSARPLPARDLIFVEGSDVIGPMGRELVPIQGKAQAETFLKDHKGQRLLKFSEVTPEVLSKLE
jgi:nitrous oxide reductase accessory protein NosL